MIPDDVRYGLETRTDGGDWWVRGQVATVMTARDFRYDPPRKYAAWLPVSHELLADGPPRLAEYVAKQLRRMLRRHLYPWEFPDPPAIAWTFEPFPRWARLASSVRRWNDRAASAVASRLDRWADSWRS